MIGRWQGAKLCVGSIREPGSWAMSALSMIQRDGSEAPTARPSSSGADAADGASEDALLLASIAAGDGNAFRQLMHRHLPTQLRLARRLLGDAQEAEDVAQDAMLRLWRNAAGITLGPGGLKPWLRRVTTNLAIDRLRARQRLVVSAELPEVAVPPKQTAGLEERELAARVHIALTSLPERQRLALQLFHFEGMSQIEVGEALGISDEAVESLLARGRRALRSELKNEWQSLLSTPGNYTSE